MNARNLTWMALCLAVLCVLSQITVPLPSGVPVTMQVLGVALCGCLLGGKGGALCVCAYLLLGLAGIPVFSGFGAGFAKLAGPTGGFLLGFLPMAALCGMARGKSGVRAWALMALGLALCHLLGAAQFSLVTGNGFLPSLALVSAPYLIKDALSLAGARLLGGAIVKRLAGAKQ